MGAKVINKLILATRYVLDAWATGYISSYHWPLCVCVYVYMCACVRAIAETCVDREHGNDASHLCGRLTKGERS